MTDAVRERRKREAVEETERAKIAAIRNRCYSQEVPVMQVGAFVTLKIAGINGPHKVAGKVTRIMPNGEYEVRTQGNGYHVVPQDELTEVR